MNYNTLAPALMGSDIVKKGETPFGLVTFTKHRPSKDCLWITMRRFQGSELNVDTYITSTNLKNYGLMMMVRRKATNIGPKQKEYRLIEKVMNYIIKQHGLDRFDTNKHQK
uniref:hypothetical protein n=1 Tax=Photobacterium leiognathi TaxID=553611 RepID=UPI003B968D67